MAANREICSGRVLDETCNENNEAYNDELLYSAWIKEPCLEKRLIEAVTSTYSQPNKKDVEHFMANFYCRQG